MVSCPFVAIVDKGQIYQTIKAIQSDVPVYAIVAPAFAGQFGKEMTSEKVRPAFQALGFKDVVEVAVGADLCTIQEARDFMREVPDEIPFMGTSCCPAWSLMVKKNFPDQAHMISMALTPMVLTARLVKEKVDPNCKICFIGPCLSKKQEASRSSVKSYVDFTLTFEEVAGMFEAKNVDFSSLPDDEPVREASADGVGFAAGGGVANAVVNYVKKLDSDRDVKVMSAAGLAECKKMLNLAKAGRYDGFLLEGMACPNGCISGAGTLRDVNQATRELKKTQQDSPIEQAAETTYADLLARLEKMGEE